MSFRTSTVVKGLMSLRLERDDMKICDGTIMFHICGRQGCVSIHGGGGNQRIDYPQSVRHCMAIEEFESFLRDDFIGVQNDWEVLRDKDFDLPNFSAVPTALNQFHERQTEIARWEYTIESIARSAFSFPR